VGRLLGLLWKKGPSEPTGKVREKNERVVYSVGEFVGG